MKKIQMVDVVSQYEKYETKINNKIISVLKSGCYIKGEEVEKFEALLSKYLNSEYTISCGNGTDALYIALMSLDLNPGDEVLVPAFTFVSTVETICLLGLKPVFMDIDPETFLLNDKLIEDGISKKTKVIIPVHLFGQCCNMNVIQLIAKKYNLYVIEDAAQSLGSKYNFSDSLQHQFSGTMGDIGITSFYPSKNLGCFGDGGAIFTQNKKLEHKMRLIANHGQTQKYIHEIIGLNSRLDTLQAAVLSFKLLYLDKFNNARQKLARYYDSRLQNLEWLKVPKKSSNTNHIYHQYSILLSPEISREDFQQFLRKNGVPTMIYYPIPLHNQKAYVKYKTKSLPVSEKVSQQIISLPMHSEMNAVQKQFICDIIEKYI